MPAVNRLGELLEAERAKRDMTLTEFAREVLGVDHGMVSRYVNGVTQPGRRTVRKIAEALGVTVAEIDEMLAEEDAKRRGRHKPGLSPTGDPDDLQEMLRQAAFEGARQGAQEMFEQMSRRRPQRDPGADPERDPVLAQMLREVREAWSAMTPEQVVEARECFRVALQRHRREEQVRSRTDR